VFSQAPLEKYSPLIGSATAQQIINKNNEAWKSFLALKKLEAEGKLPEHIRAVNSRPMRALEALAVESVKNKLR
jgi:hypothetical protein